MAGTEIVQADFATRLFQPEQRRAQHVQIMDGLVFGQFHAHQRGRQFRGPHAIQQEIDAARLGKRGGRRIDRQRHRQPQTAQCLERIDDPHADALEQHAVQP